ncbi:hypothetical protein MBM09_08320 [Flaviramulus sp. BrNp1-15]|uniref:imm11 family protein n=1 Tax=Flaviramulus sp. BrNp1-15 TaxID=2916754 RepID=UPI001EE801D7|nr:DUF1629 domain-containing protein [Flaviramulus sp. BrNp1-15]ULC57924.1 hypothetical protein MBM09_08320 [Flaviramulus sp. BrNp1-15]
MGIIMNYYLIGVENKSESIVANAPADTKLAHELVFEINEEELPFSLNLFKVSMTKKGLVESEDFTESENPWLDYLPNSLVWPLMSIKLKNVIANNLIGNEGIEWVKAKVYLKNEPRDYFIPRFNKKMDVLNQNKTKYVPGTDQIIKPSFSSSKISNYSIFHKPTMFWKITNEIYISEKIKKNIEENGLTGMTFEETSVSA